MPELERLFGRKVVVVGSTCGIGDAIVRVFLREGARLLAIDSPRTNILEQFKLLNNIDIGVVELKAPGISDELEKVVNQDFGSVDVLICNFANYISSFVNDEYIETIEDIFQKKDLIISSVINKMLPLMQKSSAGRIVIVGLNRAIFNQAGLKSYIKSESMIATLTKKLAKKTGSLGINVNYIQPGAVITVENRSLLTKEKSLRDFHLKSCIARRLGEPIDVAKVALFLASDESAFVNGTGISVNGGN